MDEMLDDAPCGFIVCSSEGIVTTANATVARILRQDRDELEGKRFESLLTLAGRIFYQTHLFPLLRMTGKAEEIFLEFPDKDGRELPMLLNGQKKLREGKEEYHIVLMPVNQRRKFEAELIQAKKTAEEALGRNEYLLRAQHELEQNKIELDRKISKLVLINEDLVQFSKVISHDIQEPIRKIALFADLVRRDDRSLLSATGREAVEKIKLSSRRMRDLITALEQFVSLSRESDGPRLCDLNEIMETARMKAIMDSREMDLMITADPLPAVQGHCGQLELLFYHLFSNAIRYKKPQTTATVRIEATLIQQNSYKATKDKYRYEDFVRIVFSDEGQGFSAEHQEYVFQLFKKLHQGSAGIGFGLAL
jgi:sigma-B regulation protein RsbU (phosphoserine phosphatase)